MKIIKLFFCLLLFFGCIGNELEAHPMPNSLIVLSVHESNIAGKIQIPLNELQSAIGMGVNDNSDRLIERLGDTLSNYLYTHIRPLTFDGKPWKIQLGSMKVNTSKNLLNGEYKELEVDFVMAPPLNYDLRNFYFNYDVILHQVASHKALIHIKQDWQQGILSEDSTEVQIGLIQWDVVSNKLLPFQIALNKGSLWLGFKNMVSLGIVHIKEGLDHILFVITLLLPSMIGLKGKRWILKIGLKASLINLLKIVSAFTIGHSLTLLLGTLEWLIIPIYYIEVLIALTIFVSACHSLIPIYPSKEVFVAAGFGLIHGLAFSETLKNLDLSVKQMALSILGFNIGIELMQIFILLMFFPIVYLISKTKFYSIFRVIGATVMMLMALVWVYERLMSVNSGIFVFG